MFLLSGITGMFGLFFALILEKRRSFDFANVFLGLSAGISFYLFFFFVQSRGPSFANATFILSLSGIFLAAWMLFYVKSYRLALVSLSPIFLSWAFAAHWEYPSTFNPFLLYGHVEFWKLGLPLMVVAIMVFNKTGERLKAPSFWLGFLIVSVASGLVSLKTDFSFSPKYYFLAILFSVFAALFFENIGLRRGDTAENSLSLILGLSLLPAVLTGLSFFQSFFGIFLPLPLDYEGISGAFILLLLVFYIIYLTGKEGDEGSTNNAEFASSLPTIAISIIFMFIPFEKNVFIYEGFRKSTLSYGWQFMGPYLLAWAALLNCSFSGAGKRRFGFHLLLTILASISLYMLAYTRAFHVLPGVPFELFQALGTPDAVWQRLPLANTAIFAGIFSLTLVALFRHQFLFLESDSNWRKN